jgi:hypothetical protein
VNLQLLQKFNFTVSDDGMPLDSFNHSSPHSISVLSVSYTFIKISWVAPLDNETDILNYQVKYAPHWDKRRK